MKCLKPENMAMRLNIPPARRGHHRFGWWRFAIGMMGVAAFAAILAILPLAEEKYRGLLVADLIILPVLVWAAIQGQRVMGVLYTQKHRERWEAKNSPPPSTHR